jgi:hypothetical protein
MNSRYFFGFIVVDQVIKFRPLHPETWAISLPPGLSLSET